MLNKILSLFKQDDAFERGEKYVESELAKGRDSRELEFEADDAFDFDDFNRGMLHALKNRTPNV